MGCLWYARHTCLSKCHSSLAPLIRKPDGVIDDLLHRLVCGVIHFLGRPKPNAIHERVSG